MLAICIICLVVLIAWVVDVLFFSVYNLNDLVYLAFTQVNVSHVEQAYQQSQSMELMLHGQMKVVFFILLAGLVLALVFVLASSIKSIPEKVGGGWWW